MPRRKFTARDLAPLAKITEKVLKREPDAALVASAAGPFKRHIPKPRHTERIDVRLPVDIETSVHPGGVPLHQIGEAVRKEFSGVSGLSVTPGGVSIKFDREPTAGQRRRIESLLSDPQRLAALAPSVREVSEAPEVDRLPDETVLSVLHDPETSDAAWLRAFRAHSLKQMIQRPER